MIRSHFWIKLWFTLSYSICFSSLRKDEKNKDEEMWGKLGAPIFLDGNLMESRRLIQKEQQFTDNKIV